MRGIHAERDDAEYLTKDFSTFVKINNEQIFLGTFRALVDYMLDLLHDVLEQNPSSMSSSLRGEVVKRRLVASKIPSAFKSINLELNTYQEARFTLFREIRNVLEHNDRTITIKFSKLVPVANVGDKISISSDNVRDILHVSRSIALDLERRGQDIHRIS